MATSAFRILQEALTNAPRHAHATHAEVVVGYGDPLRLEVTDDGVGYPTRPSPGNGLLGMRERVALYAGDLTVDSVNGRGCRVRATLHIGHQP